MSKPKLTADEWLDWADAKWREAQERFAYGSASAGKTMDSYQVLADIIERGMVAKAEDERRRGAETVEYGGIEVNRAVLLKIADDLDSKARRIQQLSPVEMTRMAQAVRAACGPC